MLKFQINPWRPCKLRHWFLATRISWRSKRGAQGYSCNLKYLLVFIIFAMKTSYLKQIELTFWSNFFLVILESLQLYAHKFQTLKVYGSLTPRIILFSKYEFISSSISYPLGETLQHWNAYDLDPGCPKLDCREVYFCHLSQLNCSSAL